MSPARADRGGRLELTYAGSAGALREAPSWNLPEIAVGGHSNAGKSSLLNALAGRSRSPLARVSHTPGRTRRLHFFEARGAGLALVDLPGYGFARASARERDAWGRMVESYLLGRENLRGLVVLLDARRDPGEAEAMLARLAAERGLGLVWLATKIDRLKQGERSRRRRALDAAGIGPWTFHSSRTGEGSVVLLREIRRLADAAPAAIEQAHG